MLAILELLDYIDESTSNKKGTMLKNLTVNNSTKKNSDLIKKAIFNSIKHNMSSINTLQYTIDKLGRDKRYQDLITNIQTQFIIKVAYDLIDTDIESLDLEASKDEDYTSKNIITNH